MVRRAAAILLSLTLVGCYSYAPATGGDLGAGSAVELSLTDSGMVSLTPLVGPFVATLDGHFVGDSADTYLLKVTKTTRRDGADTDWRGERVAVPRAFVASVATRQFSRGRTTLFGAVATGALVAIVEAFSGGGANVAGRTGGGAGSGR
jgi:hypothetical protein